MVQGDVAFSNEFAGIVRIKGRDSHAYCCLKNDGVAVQIMRATRQIVRLAGNRRGRLAHICPLQDN